MYIKLSILKKRIKMNERKIEDLNGRVTSAIFNAERLNPSDSGYKLAWTSVSETESQLAELIPISEIEGLIARRGAITASITSGDMSRSNSLLIKYLSEYHESCGPLNYEKQERFMKFLYCFVKTYKYQRKN